MGLSTDYYNSIRREFGRYKLLGENTLAQLTDPEIFHSPYNSSDFGVNLAQFF